MVAGGRGATRVRFQGTFGGKRSTVVAAAISMEVQATQDGAKTGRLSLGNSVVTRSLVATEGRVDQQRFFTRTDVEAFLAVHDVSADAKFWEIFRMSDKDVFLPLAILDTSLGTGRVALLPADAAHGRPAIDAEIAAIGLVLLAKPLIRGAVVHHRLQVLE